MKASTEFVSSHEHTNITLSTSYFLPPEPELPFVPQETSSTLQKAWITIVCEYAPV